MKLTKKELENILKEGWEARRLKIAERREKNKAKARRSRARRAAGALESK